MEITQQATDAGYLSPVPHQRSGLQSKEASPNPAHMYMESIGLDDDAGMQSPLPSSANISQPMSCATDTMSIDQPQPPLPNLPDYPPPSDRCELHDAVGCVQCGLGTEDPEDMKWPSQTSKGSAVPHFCIDCGLAVELGCFVGC